MPELLACDWCGGSRMADVEFGIRCGTCGGTGIRSVTVRTEAPPEPDIDHLSGYYSSALEENAMTDHLSGAAPDLSCPTAGAAPPSTFDRRTYIGSADIGAIVGAVGAHGNAISVFAEKTGRPREEAPEAEILWIGRVLEPAIATLYSERTGRAIEKASRVTHPTEPWAAAHPDYLAPAHALNIECKATFRFGAATWPEDAEDPPEAICAQAAWQMGLLRASGWHVTATDIPRLIASGRFAIYRVEWDEDLFAALLAAGRAFWHEHVLRDVPPPMDGSTAATDYLRARYPRSTGAILPATEAARTLARDLGAIRAEVRAIEGSADLAEQTLKAMIGEAAGIDGVATWHSNKTAGTNWKRVAESLAAEIEELTGARNILSVEAEKQKNAPARVFRLDKQWTVKEENV